MTLVSLPAHPRCTLLPPQALLTLVPLPVYLLSSALHFSLPAALPSLPPVLFLHEPELPPAPLQLPLLPPVPLPEGLPVSLSDCLPEPEDCSPQIVHH